MGFVAATLRGLKLRPTAGARPALPCRRVSAGTATRIVCLVPSGALRGAGHAAGRELAAHVLVAPRPTFHSRPQIRRDYPLNLSISLSGGKETNKDSLSNGE